jgi:hypothetical protein
MVGQRQKQLDADADHYQENEEIYKPLVNSFLVRARFRLDIANGMRLHESAPAAGTFPAPIGPVTQEFFQLLGEAPGMTPP